METTKHIIIRKIYERQADGIISSAIEILKDFSENEINKTIIPFVKSEFPNIEIHYIKHNFVGGIFWYDLKNDKVKDSSYIRKLQKNIQEKTMASKAVKGIIDVIENLVKNGYKEQKYSFKIKDDSITICFMDKIIDEFEKLDFTADFDHSQNIMTIFWNEG